MHATYPTDQSFSVLRAELASLPKNITVKVTGFEEHGEMMKAGPPCMDQTFGHCPSVQVHPIPQLHSLTIFSSHVTYESHSLSLSLAKYAVTLAQSGCSVRPYVMQRVVKVQSLHCRPQTECGELEHVPMPCVYALWPLALVCRRVIVLIIRAC